jgi:hypothetical protein
LQFTRCLHHFLHRPRSKMFGKQDTISKDVKATKNDPRKTRRI